MSTIWWGLLPQACLGTRQDGRVCSGQMREREVHWCHIIWGHSPWQASESSHTSYWAAFSSYIVLAYILVGQSLLPHFFFWFQLPQKKHHFWKVLAILCPSSCDIQQQNPPQYFFFQPSQKLSNLDLWLSSCNFSYSFLSACAFCGVSHLLESTLKKSLSSSIIWVLQAELAS